MDGDRKGRKIGWRRGVSQKEIEAKSILDRENGSGPKRGMKRID